MKRCGCGPRVIGYAGPARWWSGRWPASNRIPGRRDRSASTTPTGGLPISAVDTSLKGARSRAVPVTFANSRDVMWSQAPKPRPGQSSILVLHQGDDVLPDRRNRAVLHPQDVHAPDKLVAIVDMI